MKKMSKILSLVLVLVITLSSFSVASVAVNVRESTDVTVVENSGEEDFFTKVSNAFAEFFRKIADFFVKIGAFFKTLFNMGTKVDDWSEQEILDYYNKSVKAADEAPDSQKLHGQSTMKLKSGTSITADGGLSSVLKIFSPIVESALERNSSSTSNVPGYGEIKLSDLKSISATEDDGKINIQMSIKEQIDGPYTDSSAGPVGRAIGTLGDVQVALDELGAEFVSGIDTLTLTYTEATISVTIDKKTGEIVSGTYHYTVNVLVEEGQIKISIISPNVKNLKAYVDYIVEF